MIYVYCSTKNLVHTPFNQYLNPDKRLQKNTHTSVQFYWTFHFFPAKLPNVIVRFDLFICGGWCAREDDKCWQHNFYILYFIDMLVFVYCVLQHPANLLKIS